MAVLLPPAAASAQPVESGTITMVSDPGDYIGQGQTWSYATEAGDGISASTNGSVVSIAINGYNGDWWYLDFDAPGSQPLVPGTYTNATRYPFNGTGPGLSVSGEGRGCNELTGSYTVTQAVYGGPDSSYLQAARSAPGSPARRGLRSPGRRSPSRLAPPPSAAATPRLR